MKTAVQILISQIETEINKGGNGAMATGFDYGLKKAKQFAEELLEMEKEQIIESYKVGVWDLGCRSADSEEYYNRTFNNKNNEK
jgi:hypothetical protein